MKCPFCSYKDSKVIDSRPADDKIRRRRECLKCAKRFTTYEIVETMPLVVIKKDRSREIFDRNKLLTGLIRACVNRPVSVETLDRTVDDIEATLLNSLEREVTSETIGEMALERLERIDQVAYVRFASVYRQFGDIDSFMRELEKLKSKNK